MRHLPHKGAVHQEDACSCVQEYGHQSSHKGRQIEIGIAHASKCRPLILVIFVGFMKQYNLKHCILCLNREKFHENSRISAEIFKLIDLLSSGQNLSALANGPFDVRGGGRDRPIAIRASLHSAVA